MRLLALILLLTGCMATRVGVPIDQTPEPAEAPPTIWRHQPPPSMEPPRPVDRTWWLA